MIERILGGRMKALLFVVILFVSLLLGLFGFCQIVGTIKYFNRFPIASAFVTIILWLVILGGAYWLAFLFLQKFIWAVNVGYIISFLLSLKTTPDN